MPDITMCSGEKCPFRQGCYRYVAEPDAQQSFFEAPPFWSDPSQSGDTVFCMFYVSARKREGEAK